MSRIKIGVPIYPTVDIIDVTAPWDVLGRIPNYWKGGSIEMLLIAKTCDPVLTGQNIYLTPNHSFDECEQVDVLLVPGTQTLDGILADDEYRAFIQRQAAGARWVTSVCTGAILLAAAGLLDGYRATTHCLAIEKLASYTGVIVANGYPRFVECGNRFTMGGVSSSLDGALRLAEIITGGDAQVAKCIQLEVQYHPQPLYDCGDPAVADFTTYDLVMGRKSPHCA
jgi:cyclohexyl-isocyanide hydratase